MLCMGPAQDPQAASQARCSIDHMWHVAVSLTPLFLTVPKKKAGGCLNSRVRSMMCLLTMDSVYYTYYSL